MDTTSTPRTPDAAFAKYAQSGAYHWREISRHWLHHHAFTAERYRRTLGALGPLTGCRILDYGCGDGALLSWVADRVGPSGEAHGFDPSPGAIDLARAMLNQRGIRATLHHRAEDLPIQYFDAIICAEVIEHVTDVPGLIEDLHRTLKRGGRAVVTTPVRLTESPEDPNHVREWFPAEFAALFAPGPLRLVRHEQFIPAAAPEVYYWRPWLFLRFPVFRAVCNLLSIYGGVNALTWLRLRPRLFMTQLALLEEAD